MHHCLGLGIKKDLLGFLPSHLHILGTLRKIVSLTAACVSAA